MNQTNLKKKSPQRNGKHILPITKLCLMLAAPKVKPIAKIKPKPIDSLLNDVSPK